MNQREPSGLPLRAMVMVLLFLGVAFLLVGWQAARSGDDGDSSEPSTTVTTITSTATNAASKSAAPAAAKPEVRVYNISEIAGLGADTANRLREADWNVPEPGNLTLEGVTVTTVYYGAGPGEKEAAGEVGALLQAPVEPRIPALEAEPPGVIVAVTG